MLGLAEAVNTVDPLTELLPAIQFGVISAARDHLAGKLLAFPWPGERWGDLVPLFLKYGRLVGYREGQWVHAEGEPSNGVIIVIEGSVQLSCQAGDDAVTFAQVGPGAAFGQSEQHGGGPRLVTVVCTEPTKILALTHAALSQAAAEDRRVWQALSALLYRNLQDTLSALVAAITLDPRGRLASRLLIGCGTNKEPLKIRATQHALAEASGVSRKTVNVYLKEFEELGLVRRDYGELWVTNANGLRAIIGR